jgi:hypothetical protein
MRLPFRPNIGVAAALVMIVAARGQTPPDSGSSAPPVPVGGAESAPGEFAPRTAVDEDSARFTERDVNKDGWLSGSEAVGLRHYDANGDAEIDRDEFIAGCAGERLMLRDGSVLPEDIDLFSEFDSTGSGYISGLDIERGGVADFDTDHNNRVTRQEFYAGKARQRREMEERAKAAREEEKRRRLAAGEPEPPPPLSEVLQPRKGMMRGRVMTPDGKPVTEFTMEIVAYNIDQKNPRIDGRALGEPNLVGRFNGREGYYEIRLPDGSFGFAATITIPTKDGPKRYPLRAAGDRQTIDYIEIQRSGEGVVKNLIWDPGSSEIKPRASGS